MPWKVFYKPALQVRELKLYKRKDKTYIHFSPSRTWLKRNQKNKMIHQDTSILFELITRHRREASWIHYQMVKQGTLTLVLLEQVGQLREVRYNVWSKLYFCKIRSWQQPNHISQNGSSSSSRAVKTPDMFHNPFVFLPHRCPQAFQSLPKHTWME